MIELHIKDEFRIPEYLEYSAPPVNMDEAKRYSGITLKNADFPEEVQAKFEKAISLTRGQLSYKVGYLSGKLLWDEEGFPVLPFGHKSENLKKNLKNCEGVLLFAATIGSGIDRLIRRYEVSDPSLGMILQGLGAERVESLCNLFNEEVKKAAQAEGCICHPRFSPGFGDLPLTVQRDFLNRMDAGRRLGIILGDSCLMAPSKSVTAIIGIEKNPGK